MDARERELSKVESFDQTPYLQYNSTLRLSPRIFFFRWPSCAQAVRGTAMSGLAIGEWRIKLRHGSILTLLQVYSTPRLSSQEFLVHRCVAVSILVHLLCLHSRDFIILKRNATGTYNVSHKVSIALISAAFVFHGLSTSCYLSLQPTSSTGLIPTWYFMHWHGPIQKFTPFLAKHVQAQTQIRKGDLGDRPGAEYRGCVAR